MMGLICPARFSSHENMAIMWTVGETNKKNGKCRPNPAFFFVCKRSFENLNNLSGGMATLFFASKLVNFQHIFNNRLRYC